MLKEFNTLVGKNVRRARFALGDTQAGIAEKAGLTANYVARLERGEIGCSLFVARALARALCIDLGELVASQGALAPRRVA